MSTATSPAPIVRKQSVAMVLVALLLIAVNLRLAITTTSALLTALTAQGALDSITVVLVPSIPTAVFAVAGFFAARLAARHGTDRAVFFGMLALTVGLAIRTIPSPWIVVLGTVIGTGGLAIVNVLLPSVVRAHFGGAIRPVTTAYTTLMSLGSAIAAATAVPIAHWLDSATLGLGFWALPALLAAVVWLFATRNTSPQMAAREDRAAEAAAPRGRLPLGTKRLAAYFAIQSLVSYVIMGWLPTIATDAGLPETQSGLLLGVAMLVGVPGTILIVPLSKTRTGIVTGFAIVMLAGVLSFGGLLLAPLAAPYLWAALVGVAMCAFPLLLAILAGIGRDAAESARVSALTQSFAYAIATIGPLSAGAVHQLTGTWTPILVALIVAAIAQGVLGFALTRATHPVA